MHHEEKQELDDFSLEVKKIEEDAQRILAEASAKKEESIAGAKTQSANMIAKKQEELEKKKEEKLRKARLKIEEEKDELLKKGQKETENMEKSARKNIPKAVTFVLEQLDKKIGEF